jgi:hypothetical protein
MLEINNPFLLIEDGKWFWFHPLVSFLTYVMKMHEMGEILWKDLAEDPVRFGFALASKTQ